MIGFVILFPLAEVQFLVPPPATSEAVIGSNLLVIAGLVLVCLLFLLPSRPRRGRRKDRNRSEGPSRDGKKRPSRDSRPALRGKAIGSKRPKNWILVDGSNVMHWEDNTPHLEPIQRVVGALKAQGFDPGVVFDANAGWKLFGRYLSERELGQLLNLPQDQVLVVPKGSPADPWILTTARDFGARIVTNDRYRDWAGDHPEVAEPGFLIHGGLTEGRVWLDGMVEARAKGAS